MIDFQRPKLELREKYEKILFSCLPRGCEYSFANLYLWGEQRMAFLEGCVAFFSHVYGRSTYPYPIGNGDRKKVLTAILTDAEQRGIPCRLTAMTEADAEELESWFPGEFAIRPDRNSFDYVYAIEDLADLRDRRFQKKRNHVNRFCQEHPKFQIQPLTAENLPQAQTMVDAWFSLRAKKDPQGDRLLEIVAMDRAFRNFSALEMEGILLEDRGKVLAVTMGSPMGADIFDIHFEKAREDMEGAYAAINVSVK